MARLCQPRHKKETPPRRGQSKQENFEYGLAALHLACALQAAIDRDLLQDGRDAAVGGFLRRGQGTDTGGVIRHDIAAEAMRRESNVRQDGHLVLSDGWAFQRGIGYMCHLRISEGFLGWYLYYNAILG